MTLTDEIKAFFEEPSFVHLAMVRADGSPQVAPVWAALQGDQVVISTQEGSPKIKALKANPKVAMSITRLDDPYHEVHLRGHVVEFRKEGAGDLMNVISQKYIGVDFPYGVDKQITIVIEVDAATARKIPFTPKPRG